MESNKIYMDIITEYETCRSITQVAKKLGVSEERVRRTLITEGLWTSRSAEPIIRLFQEGKSVPEIAEKLMISEKTVQSYVPYSRGMYGGVKSDTAERSGDYRERMRKAEEEMIGNNKTETISENEALDIMINRKWRFRDGKRKKTGNKPWKKAKYDVWGERKYVYRLRFDLTSGFLYGEDEEYGMTDEEHEEFLKLAKAKEKISRTVLVPGEMSLHAMHYMIQRLFGWQNEHLHRFSLPDDLFKKLTDEKIGEWLELCGVLFRFPTGDNTDLYWDDDYKATQSVKTWLRSKYKKSYEQKAVSESLISSLNEIERFKNRFMNSESNRIYLEMENSLDELRNKIVMEEDFNTVLERLRLCDLFISPVEKNHFMLDKWKRRILDSKENEIADIYELLADEKYKAELNEAVDEVKVWRTIRSNIKRAVFNGKRDEAEKRLGKKAEEAIRDADDAIPIWEEAAFEILDAYNPEMYPFLDNLYYLYDFGDDWCISIVCEKRYMRMDEWDFPDENDMILMRTLKEKDGLITYRYFDENEKEIVGEERDRLAEVDVKKTPVCIASDGVSLVEDAGGIYGFYEMLKTITGDDVEEKKRMREWARGLGWTGRISDPKNML